MAEFVAESTAESSLPAPLGAHVQPNGTTFSIYSEHAEQVWLCLFDPTDPLAAKAAEQRIAMQVGAGNIHTAVVAGVLAGTRYGYRVSGPYAPNDGHFFNPQKLLLDPYARTVSGRYDSTGPLCAGTVRDPCPVDSAPFVPLGVVENALPPLVTRDFERPSATRLVIGEAHVRGLTLRHPDIPPELRGTYQALAHPAIVRHLQRLGINAIELLPVHAVAPEPRLQALGLSNYWGYSPMHFFALNERYAEVGRSARDSFRAMVRTLHEHSIEVIVDVVYNHTGELDAAGPMFGLRGIDNRTYYERGTAGGYANPTGCGNALRTEHPTVVRLVVDSLRYFASELGVDGFRFDLGTVLGRTHGKFNPNAALLGAIAEDPLLRERRLIAEPWDLETYALGGFPLPFLEWNDRFRDDVRGLFAGDRARLGRVATRLAGSSDVFEKKGFSAGSGVNFVAAHDGFTLLDSVSYVARHNDANGEENRDGHSGEISCNHGVEGPSSDPSVQQLRAVHLRSMLMVLFLSKGIPMLSLGDELGRTQAGNNNAYCHDGDLTWIDWAGRDEGLIAFVGALAALRKSTPVLTDPAFYRSDGSIDDARWYDADGVEMDAIGWQAPSRASLALLLGNGCVLLLNAERDPVRFLIPSRIQAPKVRIWSALGPIVAVESHRIELPAHCVAWLEST
jgi:glycogen debranching enzyme